MYVNKSETQSMAETPSLALCIYPPCMDNKHSTTGNNEKDVDKMTYSTLQPS